MLMRMILIYLGECRVGEWFCWRVLICGRLNLAKKTRQQKNAPTRIGAHQKTTTHLTSTMSATEETTTLTFSLPPGLLGVTIQPRHPQQPQPHAIATTALTAGVNTSDVWSSSDSSNKCIIAAGGAGPLCVVVSKTEHITTPLEVQDIVVSLNGITLSEVTGGLDAWVTLFGAFAHRTVVVIRQRPATTMTTTMTTTTTTTTATTTTSRLPHPVADVAAAAATTASTMTTAATHATVPTAAVSAMGGALRSLPLSLGNTGASATTTTTAKKMEKKKTAKDKKRKVPPQLAMAPYNKKKATKTRRDDEFEHDDNYMKMLTEGYPNLGRVSPCLTYYVANNNDTYIEIAGMIGLNGSWKLLNDVEFNKRFYGVLTGNTLLKSHTVVKIPTNLVRVTHRG
jgi:hypothetical protein